MSRDIEELLRQGMERATGNVRLPAGLGARAVRRHHRRRLAVRAGLAGGLAAVTGAGLTAGGLVGGGGPAARQATGRSGIAPAAMIRHIAAASSVVLAKAGHVRITYKGTTDGKVDAAGTDDIRFSGENFNDVSDQTKPPNGRSVNRVVNGQFYEYGRGFTRGHPLQPRWVHDTNPRGHPGRGAIPDPRKLLRALQPDARFERAGYQVAGGVRLEHLRAANVSVLPRRLTSIPGAGEQCLAERANGAGCSSRVAALDVWVDGHGVVHRMRLAFSKTTTVPVFTISQNRNGKTIVRPLVTVIKVTPGRDGKRPKLVKACIEGTPQRPEKVWHESCERVRESHANVTEHRKVHRSSTVVSVRFLDIGKPQTITAPSHAIPVRGRG